ncbi:MAG: LysR substrate-binding domain-containing protein [Candidatus Acidiferrales bacterium]
MYPGIELRLLRYAVAVAEELHFTRAALRLHLAQPSLSKQIRDLEEDVGTPLFTRDKHRVELTRAGRIFVKQAQETLAQAERTLHLVRQVASSRNSQLQIAYTPTINFFFLSAVRNLAEKDPARLAPTFQSFSTPEQVQLLLDAQIDAGFITLPLRNRSLFVKPIIREPLLAALPSSHPLTGIPRPVAAQLRDTALVCSARRLHPAFFEHLHKSLRRAGYKPKTIQEVTTDAEAVHMVQEGVGVAFVKPSAIPSDGKSVRLIEIPDLNLVEETGFIWRRDSKSRKLDGFLVLLRGHAQELARQSLSQGVKIAQPPDPRQLRLF